MKWVGKLIIRATIVYTVYFAISHIAYKIMTRPKKTVFNRMEVKGDQIWIPNNDFQVK